MRHPRGAGSKAIVALCVAGFATANPSYELLRRASTCPDPTYSTCNATGLPSSFCCPSTATCIPLAANTTLLCCPSGGNCDQIQSITCDITQQNATLHPDNQLKTSALGATLPVCGSACCPFGYTCTSTNTCSINANQNVAPVVSSSSSSTSTSGTSSTRSSPSTHSTSTSTSTSVPSSSTGNGTAISPITSTYTKFPIAAVLVGFFPGLILGVLLTFLSIAVFGAHRARVARREHDNNSIVSFGVISEPQPSEHVRSDFLRKPPQTPSSTAGTLTRTGTVRRVKSLFKKSGGNEYGTGENYGMEQSPRPPAPLVVNKANASTNATPVTPPLQRERSYENVDIFADQHTASSLREHERSNAAAGANGGGGLQPGNQNQDIRGSHQTTMTDVMGLAGLPKGQPYVYKRASPSHTPSPKTRGT